MIAYFDTSAILPLLVDEPSTEIATRVWRQAEVVVSVRLVYAEARAALARAQRVGRVSADRMPLFVDRLDEIYEQVERLGIDETLVRRAGRLAEDHGLRGYDAVHLAGAERVADEQTVVVSGDQELCESGRRLGLAVADLSRPE